MVDGADHAVAAAILRMNLFGGHYQLPGQHDRVTHLHQLPGRGEAEAFYVEDEHTVGADKENKMVSKIVTALYSISCT